MQKIGAGINEKVVRSETLSDFDIIAIATHGVQSNEFLEINEPALLLPFASSSEQDGYDGALLASEIAQLDLDAELVLLSACNTAYGDQDYNETLSGLTSSFLIAGAKSLIVSNWAIDSKSTPDFTTEIFNILLEDETLTVPKALQLATKKIRSQGFDHPFYWASLSYAGR